MARVDPGDDSIERFIVRHYRYDPQRRERRHVVVAAFDNEREYQDCMADVQSEIRRRREAGEPVDPREHVSGIVHEPGYLRRAANGHLITRAIRHGAAGGWIDSLELPSNMSVMRAERPPGATARSTLTEEAGPFVIGEEMAAARAAQTRHQDRAPGPSPLAGVAYQGDLSLLRFITVRTDELIDAIVDRFEASSREDRVRLRSALTMRDFSTLLTYARRAVVRALRSGDYRVARRGVIALAIADYDRVDWRDLAWQAGLLSYAIGRISGDISGLFQEAAALGEGENAALLAKMAREPAASLSQWGFRLIDTAGGIGLIADGASRTSRRRTCSP